MLDTAYEELLGAPPEQFAETRKAIVSRLRQAGANEEARRVAAARKPTQVVWAVNQVARRFPAKMQLLLDSAERLRRAQTRALGGGSGEELLEAGRATRQQAAELGRVAQKLLSERGPAPSPARARRIAQTLEGAATADDAAVRNRLARGTLEVELQPSFGFGLAGAAVAGHAQSAARPAASARATGTVKAAGAAKREAARQEAAKRREELKQVAALAREARRARKLATARREQHRRDADAAARAQAQAQAAAERATFARRQALAAAERAAQSRQAADTAERAAAQAESAAARAAARPR